MQKLFLQTDDWLEFQKSLGRQTWQYDDGKIWANVVRHDGPLGTNYLYVIAGPEIALDKIDGGVRDEIKKFTQWLKDLAWQNRSIFVRLEPLRDSVPEFLYASGTKLKKSKRSIQPHRTVVIDLTPSEYEIRGKMHHKTRYNINLAERKGLRFEPDERVHEFWHLLQRTAQRDRFFTHPKEYYEKLVEFFQGRQEVAIDTFGVFYGKKSIAAAIVLTYGRHVYYLHGASDYEHRALMAPYLLHWEIMRHYKAKGYTEYDLWGIDAKRWPGVTRFKLGWGGDVIEYPGAFDLPIRSDIYLLYRLKEWLKNKTPFLNGVSLSVL